MSALPIPVIAAWTNAGILLAAGLANLVGFSRLRELYSEFDIPAWLYRMAGIAEILAALFLLRLESRVYGILLAAPIMFVSVILLLDHQRYEFAGLVAFFLAVLVAATLAVPPSRIHYAAELQSHFIAANSVILREIQKSRLVNVAMTCSWIGTTNVRPRNLIVTMKSTVDGGPARAQPANRVAARSHKSSA